MTKEKKTTNQGKPSKNYILSNNVVINLEGLISTKRKSSSKPKSIEKREEKQESSAIGRTTPFTNISNLDTQIQQANLRAAENRFQNSSKLPSETSTNRETTNPQIYTNPQPENRFRRENNYYDINDNAGAFGTIQGSDTFPAQGNNNIPIHEQNDDMSDDSYRLGLETLLGNYAARYDNDDYSLRSGSDIGAATLVSDSSNSSSLNSDELSQKSTGSEEYNLTRNRTYTIDEVKLWLANDKLINPKRRLIRPAPGGRMYAKISGPNSAIYKELSNDAFAYGLLK